MKSSKFEKLNDKPEHNEITLIYIPSKTQTQRFLEHKANLQERTEVEEFQI